jgi:hypothetical protein
MSRIPVNLPLDSPTSGPATVIWISEGTGRLET